jgi:Leucine-rich repeat (LRR) protein
MRDTLSFRSAEESVPDVNETWAVLLQHYGQPNSETLEEATEINIEAFLKPNGPGVKYLNGALRYLPKLKRMYTSALTANVTANLAGTSLPSLSERVESTTESTPASSEETWGGFLLALYAAYNGAYDVPEKAFAEFPFTTLQVPAGFKSIGREAFQRCQNLQKVELPEGIERIEFKAFEGCISLTSIKFPASLEKVGGFAFTASGIESVHFPAESGVKVIAEGTFSHCQQLKEVRLPAGLEIIGNAFIECHLLETITSEGTTNKLPASLRAVKRRAFHGCKSLTKVDLKATQLTIIKEMTFLNCNLVEVELPPSLESIGEAAFANCQQLTSINFPETLQTIEEEAFHGCSSLTKVDLKATQLTIISNKTFLNCNLVEVELPPSLQSIGEQAFANCQKLTSINFPKTLQTIKKEAFLNCKGVEQLVMPASLQEIGRRAFKRCGIEYVQFPAESGLQAVENQAFEECASLKNVDLAATKLKIISEETFKNCEKLEKVILPQNLTEIKKDAFYHCIKLVSIEWPPTLRSIGDGAFQMCPLPEEQWLSAAAEIKIGDHAFGPGPVLVGSAPLADAPADALLTEARRIEPASDAAAPRSTLSWKEGAAIAGGVAGGGLAWVTVQGAKALLDQNRAKKKSGPKKR